MATPSLQASIDKIEAFCNNHGLVLFYGSSDVDLGPQVLWNGDEEEEVAFDRLLDAALRAGVKIVHLDREYNYLAIDEEKLQDTLSYCEDEETRAEIMADVELVRKNEGGLLQITLAFFYGGGCYLAEQKAEWSGAHSYVEDFLSEGDDDEDDDNDVDDDDDDLDDEEDDRVQGHREESDGQLQEDSVGNGQPFDYGRFSPPQPPSPEVIEAEARKLLHLEKYLNADKSHQRSKIAKHTLMAAGFLGYIKWSPITERAEELYQQEIKPQLDQEAIEKIRAYLQSTKNPSMAGAARLFPVDERNIDFRKRWKKALE